MLLAVFLAFVSCPGGNGEDGPSIIPMELVYQHKDTAMPCNPCISDPQLNPDPHTWNHAAGTDGIYGNVDDCPHCSTYCAPASIAIIANAYGRTAEKIEQDWIFDGGKDYPAVGDGMLNAHDVGMDHGAGSTPSEIQNALNLALDPMTHEEYNAGNPISETILNTCIENKRPVLWLDYNVWPVNQNSEYPHASVKSNQGHAKVVAGYDDRGTSDTSDDRCLIYDPWPEYNDLGLLPTGAAKGPDDTFDPYWLPVSSIIEDSSQDVFLVPQDSIP